MFFTKKCSRRGLSSVAAAVLICTATLSSCSSNAKFSGNNSNNPAPDTTDGNRGGANGEAAEMVVPKNIPENSDAFLKPELPTPTPTVTAGVAQPTPATGISDFYACDGKGGLSWEAVLALPLDKKCVTTRVKVYKHWTHNFFVQLRECNNDPMKYEIKIGTSGSGPFYWIADGGGHGQDQCEFVNRAFRISNDDDIKSQCPTCDMGCRFYLEPAYYTRSKFGETPTFDTESHWWADSVIWHSCAISFDNAG